ncbi:MAG: hypothetical protein P8Y23_11535, partial [Candidatus Lokiarchaeota archaeon]
MEVAFSKINITPREYIGKPLAGYSRKEPCSGKLDNIYAYSLLIDCSNSDSKGSLLLIVAIDLLKIPISVSNYIKEKIIKNHTFLRKEQILIHATHSHAGFDLTGEFFWPGGFISVMRGIMFGVNRNDKYIVWFCNKIAIMVDELFKHLVACKCSWKKVPFNPNLVFNRRNPSKQILPNLGVITFKSLESNSLIGMIINYACHPTTLSYQNSKLSADFIGQIHANIAQMSHNRIKSVYINGASGDLNPITTFKKEGDGVKLEKEKIYDQFGTYEDTKRIGDIIARRALELANSITDTEYYIVNEIKIYSKDFAIPMRDVKYFSKNWISNKLIFLIKKLFLINIAKYQISKANFPIFALDSRFGQYKCNTIVQYIRLKTKISEKLLGIITVPGELFYGLGDKLLKASPCGVQNTLIF